MKKILVLTALLLYALISAYPVRADFEAYAVLYKPACIRPRPQLKEKCTLNINGGEKTILRSGLVNGFYKVQYHGRIGWIHKSRVCLIYK